MIEILGDYALNTSANAVMQSKANKDYYLAELKGIRLSIINESKKGAYLDEELVKSLVDSGEIQARQIYQAPITFQPVAAPILTTNYRPKVTADYSIARRIIFVPFDFQLPADQRNPNFREEVLKPELSGILNLLLPYVQKIKKVFIFSFKWNFTLKERTEIKKDGTVIYSLELLDTQCPLEKQLTKITISPNKNGSKISVYLRTYVNSRFATNKRVKEDNLKSIKEVING